MNSDILNTYESYYKAMTGTDEGKSIAAAILTKLEYKVEKGL